VSTEHREKWLSDLIVSLVPHFADQGYTINPEDIRVSCGFPGGGSKFRRIGECWSAGSSEDNKVQIFINPILDDRMKVAEVLVHELCHAAVGVKEKHNYVFGKCARAVGLTGNLRSTTATDELKLVLQEMVCWIGEYPHGAMKIVQRIKGPYNVMTKAHCHACSYEIKVPKGCEAMPSCGVCGVEFIKGAL